MACSSTISVQTKHQLHTIVDLFQQRRTALLLAFGRYCKWIVSRASQNRSSKLNVRNLSNKLHAA